MKKFLRSGDLYSSGVNNPSWTDTEGFYQRVGWLDTESHAASNDDEDIKDYFMCLEQLHIEINGAISQNNDREKLESVRKKVQKQIYDRINNNRNLAWKRETVRPYHLELCNMCHKYGLFLRKTTKETLDDWDEQLFNEFEQGIRKTVNIRTHSTNTIRQPERLQKP